MGPQRAGHNWATECTLAHTHTHTHTHTHKDDFQALAGDSTYIGPLFQYSCLENPMDRAAWWAAVHGVAKSWTWLSDFTFTFHFHALEKEMATHSSVLAWRIPGMGEPGGLTSMGSHRVGHDWSDLPGAAAAAANKWLSKGLIIVWLNYYCLLKDLFIDLAKQGLCCSTGDLHHVMQNPAALGLSSCGVWAR